MSYKKKKSSDQESQGKVSTGQSSHKSELTEDQIKMVQDSWAMVKVIDPSYNMTGVMLFKNIFEFAP